MYSKSEKQANSSYHRPCTGYQRSEKKQLANYIVIIFLCNSKETLNFRIKNEIPTSVDQRFRTEFAG